MSLRVPVLVTGAVALLLRVVYLLESSGNPFRTQLGLDTAVYDEWARAILSGQGLGGPPFTQAPFFPIVLALIYAVLGAEPVRALWGQLLPGVAAVVLVAWAAGRWKGPRAAWIAGGLLALYKPAIFYTGVLLPPVWTLALAALALWSVRWSVAGSVRESKAPGLAAGLAFGALALAQPTALAAAVPVAIGPARGRRLRFIAGVALPLFVTLLYNGIGGGAWTPVAANGGVNLYIGNGPEATGAYVRPPGVREDRDLLGIEAARAAAGASEGGAALAPGVGAAANADFGVAEANRWWTRRALDSMVSAPGRTLALYGRKLLFYFGQYEIPQIESLAYESQYSTLLRIPLPGMAWLSGLALFGVVLLWKDRTARWTGAAALLLGLAAAVFFVTGRFRAPAAPFLAVLAGGGVAEAWARTSALRARRGLVAAGAGVAAIVLLSINATGIDTDAAAGQNHFRLGVIAEREGRPGEAMEAYRRALEVDPTIAKAEINLGTLLARQGRLDEARSHLERGVRLDPMSAVALVNLGQLHQLQGRTEEAITAYRRAQKVDPQGISAPESEALLLYESGRIEEARSALEALTRVTPENSPSEIRAQTLLRILEGRTRAGWEADPRMRAGDLRFAQGDRQGALRLYAAVAAGQPMPRPVENSVLQAAPEAPGGGSDDERSGAASAAGAAPPEAAVAEARRMVERIGGR